VKKKETVYGIFREIAERYEDKPAVIEAERTLTYKELLALTDRIAETLPDDVRTIGIVMSHRAEMIAAMLAVLKCGARYVPAEPSFPVGRIRYMMKEAEVDYILTERRFQTRIEGFPFRLIDCEICMMDLPGNPRPERAQPDSPAYILYTSGTTGHPKGVCVTNRNICHYVRAFADEFHPGPEDIMLQYSVCTFDIFVEEVYASLLNGMAVAIPAENERADIKSLMDFVSRHGVTILSGFPYLLADMNHLEEIPHSLRLLISGGDVLREAYVDRLLGQTVVYNTYGPSETTVCASYYRCNGGTVLEDGTYPIGHAVKGAQIRILDEDGREVPRGSVGEICIYGGGVSTGYIGDHREENRAFVNLDDGSSMYRSGDLGYVLPDGSLAFLHRIDSQIMIYGKRVEVKEVESCLYQCRNIQQAVVRPCTDEDGLAYMIAYIVPASTKMKISEVRAELSENLPSFMIPEYFVQMSSIPLNTNGKPDFSRMPLVLKGGEVQKAGGSH
jgi:D-alanine--poly(phosphoribitol) ligase subunit 1